MSLPQIAERLSEVVEAQPRLVNLVQDLIDAHRELNLTDEKHAALQGLTNEAMEILLDLGR